MALHESKQGLGWIAFMRSLTSNVKHGGNISVGGFTLVEMMIVMVIIGVAAMIVVPSMSSAGTLSVQAASRAIISDVVFAQNEAVSRQSKRRVVFDVANNQYTITDADGVAVQTKWLNGDHVISFANDPRFTDVQLLAADFDGQNWVEFDDLGAPLTSGTVDLKSEGAAYRITVASFTGRVTIEPLVGN